MNVRGATIAVVTWLALAIGVAGQTRAASVLYGATGSNGVNGELVILNPATGAVTTDVGPLVDASGKHYGLTGLAFSPSTGVLYGSTANASPTAPGTLVTINPATGLVAQVGSFGVVSTMADLTFDPTTGALYGWQAARGDSSLYSINPTTGAGTRVGPSGVTGIPGGGGLAANAAGTLFVSPNGETGDLDIINHTTGLATTVATLTGAPLPGGAINAMAFDSDGTLYGSDSDQAITATLHLVTINTTTGAITDRGATLDNLDAIAFRTIPEPPSVVSATLGLLAALGFASRLHRPFAT
jgi:hypothetical protein